MITLFLNFYSFLAFILRKMLEVKKVWMDGKMVNFKSANIHILSHALHYGSAVFEGIRFYETEKGPAVFRLKEHTDRLFYSAKVLYMKIPFSKTKINKSIAELIKVNKLKEGYIRPIVYYGYGKMGLKPIGAPVNMAIAAWPWGSYLGEGGVKVKVSKVKRIHPETTDPKAKISGIYVNSILASMEAHKQGYDEALLLDHKGCVSEGPGENFFYIKNGKIYTTELGTILPGITRNSVMTFASDLKLEVKEKRISLKDIQTADEAFFTGTAAEVTPIIKINSKKVGKGKIGPITKQIKNYYSDIIHGKVKKYEKWLYLV